MYTGITVDLDASALHDSGSVVAGQYPLAIQTHNYSYAIPEAGSVVNCHMMDTNFLVNFPGAHIAQLPGAFMGLAKDGCYMPLKLDAEARWIPTTRCEGVLLANQSIATDPTIDSLRQRALGTAAIGGGATFPFYGGLGVVHDLVPAYVDDHLLQGDIVVPFQQLNMGLIYFYNLNPAASLTIKVRWGVEMRVDPTSILAPALQPSAIHDVVAMRAYSDVAGGLPWAYPSDYNANGKILEVIGKVWNVLKPTIAGVLRMIPNPAAQAFALGVDALPKFERPAGQGTRVVTKQSPSLGGQPRPARSKASKTKQKRNKAQVIAALSGK
jgi:hypothetical protein